MTNEGNLRRRRKFLRRVVGSVPFNALLGLAVAAPLCAATLPTERAVCASAARHDWSVLIATMDTVAPTIRP